MIFALAKTASLRVSLNNRLSRGGGVFFFFFLAAPMAYRSFQARNQMQVTAVTNTTAVATLDPQLAEPQWELLSWYI